MANTPVALTTAVVNTATGDLVGSGTAVAAANTFTIAARDKTDDLVLILEAGAGASVVTFNAGAYPGSALASKGNLVINLASADVRLIQLEGGRFIQADGTITGSVATTLCNMTAIRTSRKW